MVFAAVVLTLEIWDGKGVACCTLGGPLNPPSMLARFWRKLASWATMGFLVLTPVSSDPADDFLRRAMTCSKVRLSLSYAPGDTTRSSRPRRISSMY